MTYWILLHILKYNNLYRLKWGECYVQKNKHDCKSWKWRNEKDKNNAYRKRNVIPRISHKTYKGRYEEGGIIKWVGTLEV